MTVMGLAKKQCQPFACPEISAGHFSSGDQVTFHLTEQWQFVNFGKKIPQQDQIFKYLCPFKDH